MKTESAGALYKGNLGYDDVGFFSGIQDFFLVFYRSMESCDAFWAWSVIFIVGPKTYTGYLSKNIQMIKFNMDREAWDLSISFLASISGSISSMFFLNNRKSTLTWDIYPHNQRSKRKHLGLSSLPYTI